MILKFELRFSTFRQSPKLRFVWDTLCDDSWLNTISNLVLPTGTHQVIYLGYELAFDCFSL